MRINSFCIIAVILLVITSCSPEKTEAPLVEYSGFNKEYQLKSNTEEWLDIRNPGDLSIYDSLLVIIDWKRKGGSIRVYDIINKKFLGTFGGFGKGPGEFFSSPLITPITSVRGNDRIIQLYDNGRDIFLNINLTKSLEKNMLIEESVYKIPEGIVGYRSVMLGDSVIYYADFSSLNKYNVSGGQNIRLNEPIDLNQNLPKGQFEAIARIMYPNISPDHKYIISTFNVIRRIHVYDSIGEFLRVIQDKGRKPFRLGEQDIYKNNREHFTNSFLSDKYILVLDTDRIIGNAPPSKLLLFSYEGDALSKYNIDCWTRYGAVDWKSKTIYISNFLDGTVVSYKLPGIDE